VKRVEKEAVANVAGFGIFAGFIAAVYWVVKKVVASGYVERKIGNGKS